MKDGEWNKEAARRRFKMWIFNYRQELEPLGVSHKPLR